MKKTMLLLVNPHAGKGRSHFGFEELLSAFYSGGYAPTVYFTEGPGDARRIAREQGGNYDLFVCLGGDGTLSDVMGGLAEVDPHPPIGYIPAGTANDVATTLSLSRNLSHAGKTILNGKKFPYDLGRFGEDGFFSYVAAFGAFTDVSYETPQESKAAWGHLAYIFEGMARLPKLRSYKARVEYDEGVIEDEFIFGGVTNSTSVAGLVKLDNKRVGLGDGRFEIILVKKPNTVLELNSIFTGLLSQNYDNENVFFLHSSRVLFTFPERVAWTRDGENGGMHDTLTLTCLPHVHDILVDSY